MKVTVVTPVFNGASTIEDCIKSIKLQTYKDIEHLVVDGGSTDGTIDIVKAYNIRYISELDAGIYDAFNKGVSMAEGDIIHILNSDDMYADARSVEIAIEQIKKYDLDLCHGCIEQIDSEGKVVRRLGKDVSKKELLVKMRAAHPATFVKRSVYQKFGSFNAGFKIAADQDFLLRVWDKIETGFVPFVFVKMRLGGASNSQVTLSCKESMATAIIHGMSPAKALCRYYLELIKNKLFGDKQ